MNFYKVYEIRHADGSAMYSTWENISANFEICLKMNTSNPEKNSTI